MDKIAESQNRQKSRQSRDARPVADSQSANHSAAER